MSYVITIILTTTNTFYQNSIGDACCVKAQGFWHLNMSADNYTDVLPHSINWLHTSFQIFPYPPLIYRSQSTFSNL